MTPAQKRRERRQRIRIARRAARLAHVGRMLSYLAVTPASTNHKRRGGAKYRATRLASLSRRKRELEAA